MINLTQANILERIHQGNIAFNDKQYEQALMHYDNALALDPKHLLAIAGKAKSFLQLQEFDRAYKYFDMVAEIAPNSPHAILGTAFIAFGEEGDGDAALPHIERVLKISPGFKDALTFKEIALQTLLNKAYAFFEAKNYDAAIAVYDKIIEHALEQITASCKSDALTNKRAALFEKVKIEKQAGFPYKAEAILKQMLETNSKDAHVLTELGSIEFDRKKYIPALQYFQQAHEYDPSHIWSMLCIKKTLFALLPQATTIQQLTVSLRSLFGVATGLLNIREHKEAAIVYFDITQMVADSAQPEILSFKVDAFVEMAQIYKSQGEIAPAITACQAALALNPTAVPGLNTLGNIYLSQHNYQDALTCFNKALETEDAQKNPQLRATLWRNKIGVYQEMKDAKNMMVCATEYLKIFPTNKEILSVAGSTLLGTVQSTFSKEDLLQGLKLFAQATSQEQDANVKQSNEQKLVVTARSLITALSQKMPASELEPVMQFISNYVADKPYLNNELFMTTYNYAFSCVKQNNHTKAAAYFEKAADLNPTYQDAWQNAFVSYNNCEDYQSVIALMDKLIATNSPIRITQGAKSFSAAEVKQAYVRHLSQLAAPSSVAPHAAMHRQAASNNDNNNNAQSNDMQQSFQSKASNQ